MEKKIKIFKIIAIVFIIITISLISFVGIFRANLNAKTSIIPEFVYGMELDGTREFKFTLDTDSEEVEVYVDENGKYMGTVIPAEETANTGGISLDATTDNLDEAGDIIAEEEAEKVPYETITKTIKANEDSVLNQESYEQSKKIIQTRLEQAKIPEYNIRLDNITGNLILEVPENETTDTAYELALAQGKFEMIDGQTGVVLLDSNDIKKATSLFYADMAYQAILQIEFKDDKIEKLREISNTYVEITNENGEKEAKTVQLRLDGETFCNTCFVEELTNGILQITMGEQTTDLEVFAESQDASMYFANLINNGQTPNAYKLVSDNFVQSPITEDMKTLGKLIFAAAVAIVSIVMICKYKFKGFLGALASIGYIAITLLAIRYTYVTITLNSLIAFIGIVAVNYIFVINYLNRLKTDSAKHAFVESMKEINITIIPLWIVAIVFTFMVSSVISSVGMVMFWGLFVQVIYSFLITRSLYID